MTYLPGQEITFPDGNVGFSSPPADNPLVVGVSSSGTEDTLYKFSNPQTVVDTLGYGPAVEVAAAIVAQTGGVSVLKTGASTAGVAGAVTKTAVGTSTGTISVAGEPYDAYDVTIEILSATTYRYTLDGGATYAGERVIPAGGTSTLGDTGLTLTWTDGAGPTIWETGDTHAFTCTAPHYSTSDLSDAFAALDAQIGTDYVELVFFTGSYDTAADAATMAGAASTVLSNLSNAPYYARGIIDAGSNDTTSNVKTSLLTWSNARLLPVYGNVTVATQAPQAGWGSPTLPGVLAAAERASIADVSESLGRKLSGALRGVTGISHDEDRDTKFTAADKVTTFRSYRGEAGFFIALDSLHSPAGSDYRLWSSGRVIDRAARVTYRGQGAWTLASLFAKTDGTGNITDLSASRVEGTVRGQLSIGLTQPQTVEGDRGYVSGMSYVVNRANDFLGSNTIQSTLSIVGRPTVEKFVTQIGFARSL